MEKQELIEEFKTKILGMEIQSAREMVKEYNFSIRQTAIDGKAMVITMDLRFDRFNVKTVNGIIKSVGNMG